MQTNNYDRVAGIYDRLSRLVFGDAIYQAQLFLLEAIPAGAQVLVVGGGTGWILEEMAHRHSSGLQICYVELSEQMMSRSKTRNTGSNKVTFVKGAIQDIVLQQNFNVVITPFLLDNFSAQTHQQVFKIIDDKLKAGGLWLFADFQPPRKQLRHQLLLKIMYLFFGLFCRLEASRLPDSAAHFKIYNYVARTEKTFYAGFIRSVVYQKPHL